MDALTPFLPGSWAWYRGSRGRVLHSTLTTVVLAGWRGCAETRAPRDACTPAPAPEPQDEAVTSDNNGDDPWLN